MEFVVGEEAAAEEFVPPCVGHCLKLPNAVTEGERRQGSGAFQTTVLRNTHGAPKRAEDSS